ncbi:MAG: histidine phosphatase family protein [Candidatus Kapabacteria bacterium]|nr:histidine phosphatase family protein [Candidatus Kapabacteria bacterium]MCS7169766.1 histidine phosphatase family protein [Candidatus Kapabacteria bacterium]MDW7996414.1 histidine phosphatase family protein [Bacteroidota bacterium]MDW8225886.1 histidine phosphatase family protein [Bacteroidota bacterium]
MLLCFMRHAHAEAGTGIGDPVRQLSPQGRAQLQQLLPLVRALQVRPDWIISSPYQRALQTAQIVAEGLGYTRDIISDISLSPTGSTVGLQALLIAFVRCEQLLLVGHAPSMPTWIRELCGASQFRLSFSPGAICCVELPEPQRWNGTLRWLVSLEPEHGVSYAESSV